MADRSLKPHSTQAERAPAGATPHQIQTEPSLLLAVGVLLPPAALDVLGPLAEERSLQTPFGPVGPLALRRQQSGPPLWVLPYTGSPVRTDPRATVYAAAGLGLSQLLLWDIATTLHTWLHRGQTALAADFIDATRRQPHTFAGTPNIELPEAPLSGGFCPQMTAALKAALPLAPEVVYLGVDGPQRESMAEARMYRTWAADVIGHNLLPEARLAREMGLCCAGLLTVNSYAADLTAPSQPGEVRSGLGAALAAFPEMVAALAQLGRCTCAHPAY